jgi:hypothetical protein
MTAAEPAQTDDKNHPVEQPSTEKPSEDKAAPAPKPESLTDEKGQPMIHVKVYAPFQVYFDEPAYSISAENHTGPFDILPKHHNFITLLNPCELHIQAPKRGLQRILISSGIMHVNNDRVVVFLNV